MKTKRTIIVAIALLLLCFSGFRYLRYRIRVSHDTFSQHLASLAGSDAVFCGAMPGQTDSSLAVERAIASAFTDKKHFWSREPRHYNYFETGEQEDVSEGVVSTPTGEVFRLVRYEPTWSRPARVAKYRWVNPHIKTRTDGTTYLSYDDEERTGIFTLDP